MKELWKNIQPHVRPTLKLAYPVSLSQLGHVLLTVTDNVMVGHLGAAHLAAASLVMHIFFLSIVIAAGLTLAIIPLVAQADGEDNPERCSQILNHGLMLNCIMGVILVVAQYFMADYVYILGQPADVEFYAQSYLRILGFSFIPFMIALTYRNFIEGLSFTKPAMYIVFGANILNVFGNWVFIYGNLGSPAFGLDGAGYSTLLNEVFIAVAMVLYTVRSGHFAKYRPLFRIGNYDRTLIKRILKIGLPTSIHYLFEAGSISVYAIMIGWLGAEALAAHQVAISLASISFMLAFGLAAAVTIRIGNAIGRSEPHQAKYAGYTGMFFSMVMMAVFGAVFIIFRNVLPTLYIANVEVVSLAADLLVVAALFQVFDGLQSVGIGALRGLEDTRVPMFVAIFAYWIIGIPVAYMLNNYLDMGVIGIWTGLLLGLGIAATLFTLRFRKLIHVRITAHG